MELQFKAYAPSALFVIGLVLMAIVSLSAVGAPANGNPPEVVRFMDVDHVGRWAVIRMPNGDPVWVSIAQEGILVKKSSSGITGALLYEEKNIYKAARTAMALDASYPRYRTPEGMFNPVLKAFVNAIIHCDTLAEVSRVLNEAYQE